MSVKKILSRGIVIGISLMLFGETAYSSTQMAPSSHDDLPRTSASDKGNVFSRSNPLGSSFINIGPVASGIIIHVQNGSLVNVLQQIANHTNIQFKIANPLTSQKVNVNIQAENWETGVENLLKEFSKITVWDKFSKMETVTLLGPIAANSPESFKKSPPDYPLANNRAEKQGKPGLGLSVAKLKKLVKVKPGNSIPADLFADREIRRYLKLKGIHSPSDWKQSKKGRVVQHAAKRELIKLLYKQQSRSKVN